MARSGSGSYMFIWRWRWSGMSFRPCWLGWICVISWAVYLHLHLPRKQTIWSIYRHILWSSKASPFPSDTCWGSNSPLRWILSHSLSPKCISLSTLQSPRAHHSEPSYEMDPLLQVPSSWSASSAVCATPTTLLSTSTGAKFPLSPKSCRFYSSCTPFRVGLLAINEYMKIGHHFHRFKGEMEALVMDTDPN